MKRHETNEVLVPVAFVGVHRLNKELANERLATRSRNASESCFTRFVPTLVNDASGFGPMVQSRAGRSTLHCFASYTGGTP